MTARSATTSSSRTPGASSARPRVLTGAVLLGIALTLASPVIGQTDAARPLGAPPSAAHEASALPAPAGASIVSPTSMGRTAVSLALVLGIAVALAAAAKKLGKSASRGTLLGAMGPGGPSPSGLLEVLGRYPLSRQQALIVLRFDRRVLLLSQSRSARGGTSLSTICDVSDAEDVASILLKTRDDESSAAAGRFRDLIDRFDTDRGDGVAEVRAGSASQHALADRSVVESDEGDRAELLDERVLTFPLLDPRGPAAADAVGSLRRRLDGLRQGQAGAGGVAP